MSEQDDAARLIAEAGEYVDALVGGEDSNWVRLVQLADMLADLAKSQQQRIRELEQQIDRWIRSATEAKDETRSVKEQLAARDAVIARLKALPQTDWGMGNAGLDAHSVYAILAAAPESVNEDD